MAFLYDAIIKYTNLRMILIDALYINQSGGLRLLTYLVNSLRERSISFYLLADKRCEGLFDHLQNVEYLHASIINRYTWYKQSTLDYSCVLCFGNLPAPFRLKVPVYTYYHNINYLTLRDLHSVKDKIVSWVKREVYRYLKDNTNLWIVQTSNTNNEIVKNLRIPEEKVILIPFYDIPKELENLASLPHGNDYVYVANFTGSKQHDVLIEAWKILHTRGVDKVLHLTVSDAKTDCISRIKEAQEQGVKIFNHGSMPFNEVISLYKRSKATVYPSLNESLGLGIVEAISAGCDVIGSDLPFIHSICIPSRVFDPRSAMSIADAVAKYENGGSSKSELLIHNQIDEMIELITQ